MHWIGHGSWLQVLGNADIRRAKFHLQQVAEEIYKYFIYKEFVTSEILNRGIPTRYMDNFGAAFSCNSRKLEESAYHRFIGSRVRKILNAPKKPKQSPPKSKETEAVEKHETLDESVGGGE